MVRFEENQENSIPSSVRDVHLWQVFSPFCVEVINEHLSDPTALNPLSIVYLMLFHQTPDSNKHNLFLMSKLMSVEYCFGQVWYRPQWFRSAALTGG